MTVKEIEERENYYPTLYKKETGEDSTILCDGYYMPSYVYTAFRQFDRLSRKELTWLITLD
jgi:thymidylate kinase